MDERVVLVVADEFDEDTLESTPNVDEQSVVVRTLDDLSRLQETLCTDVVHCLVIDAEVDGTRGVDVARGVAGFFPDLPTIVVGEPTDGIDDAATVVDADALTDEDVIEAVGEALDGSIDSDATRPPSRMETLLLSLVDQLPAHVFVKDRDARHVLASDYQVDPATLLGATDREYGALPEHHREAAYRDDLQVIEEGEPHLDIEEFPDATGIDAGDGASDGRAPSGGPPDWFRDVRTSKVPWFDADGDVVGLAGLTQDITDQKRRDHATRRQHERLAKVALVAAHELRNELQIAHGRLEHVEDDPSQADAVAASLDRLSTVADDLVELASRERLDREEKVVWLSTISREIWDSLDAPNATRSLDGDGRVRTNPESAKLLLEIVFRNAVEHGGSDVSITVGATEEGFYVADDGTGIDVEPMDRVFDAAYTTKADKTGFGLYVAERIADDLGWTILVSESEDGGARFDVTGVDGPE